MKYCYFTQNDKSVAALTGNQSQINDQYMMLVITVNKLPLKSLREVSAYSLHFLSVTTDAN